MKSRNPIFFLSIFFNFLLLSLLWAGALAPAAFSSDLQMRSNQLNGAPSKKYCICHKQPRKQDETIIVSISAVCTHVTRHGDTSGPCTGDPISACGGFPGIEGLDCSNPICGDGVCDGIETCSTCAEDCGACPGPYCGDGTCDTGETCATCLSDCGACPGLYCGDGICSADNGETCSTCTEDCGACPGPYCGDGTCDTGETCELCSQDCGACPELFCGDGICSTENGETCSNCERDCGSCVEVYCGDGTCNEGESCGTCAEDCGTCPEPYCGDGICSANTGEDCVTCEQDCGSCGSVSYCGDGTCSSDESCGTCAEDCGVCPCADRDGDGVCDFNDNCPDVANANQADSNRDGFGDACEAAIAALSTNIITCIADLRAVGIDQDTAIELANASICEVFLEGSGSPGCALMTGEIEARYPWIFLSLFLFLLNLRFLPVLRRDKK